MSNVEKNRNKERKSIFSYIIRFILAAIVLSIASFLTPGFSIRGLGPIILASIVIMAIDSLVESIMGVDASPFGKGIKGFFIAAIIIYVAQFIVPNMNVSIIGALLASLVIGILDAVIPGRMM
ncbi:phage holin family protein [Abyssisolibacter fermentans]|uniref:phage holin family protein n=1 Tax=Abyssisolibacter fermentans TaxID=1766203 RepID=UPI00083599E2|nr:phage holin family protein [Abyssisolibacter fermentans]